MARFATVIELPIVPITSPLVRRAKVSVPAGAIAAVILMFPEFVPSTAPILTLLAVSLFSSASIKESWPPVSVPKSIWSESVRGATVITPVGADTEALIAIVSASSTTSPELEVMFPELVIELP